MYQIAPEKLPDSEKKHTAPPTISEVFKTVSSAGAHDDTSL
jgi:hypothetical protein